MGVLCAALAPGRDAGEDIAPLTDEWIADINLIARFDARQAAEASKPFDPLAVLDAMDALDREAGPETINHA